MSPTDDLLAEMGVREVWNQCRYAEVAFSNIERKVASEDTFPLVFSSIHSFLSHCGVLSRLLSSPALARNTTGKRIGEIIGCPSDLKVSNRTFRDRLEHYDEYLERWVRSKGRDVMILDNNIGSKNFISGGANMIMVRHYDPDTYIYTLMDEDMNIGEIYGETQHIKALADDWVRKNT